MSENRNYKGVISNPEQPCPPEILRQQVPIEVQYVNFDGVACTGLIEVNLAVADNVRAFFEWAHQLNFPIERVAPASEPPYSWDDARLMQGNVSTGFNYRLIAGSARPSLHSRGIAFDINPRQNPYTRYEDGKEIVSPAGANWRPEEPGTLAADHSLVQFMIDLGWEWGGNWTPDRGRVDYQHFEKPN